MRICGICKLGLRDGTTPEALRVGEEGASPDVLSALKIEGRTVVPGLYSACPECVQIIKPFCAKRITKQKVREERIAAVMEDRGERNVADVAVAELTANDLC